jgi:hypothetical protein
VNALSLSSEKDHFLSRSSSLCETEASIESPTEKFRFRAAMTFSENVSKQMYEPHSTRRMFKTDNPSQAWMWVLEL